MLKDTPLISGDDYNLILEESSLQEATEEIIQDTTDLTYETASVIVLPGITIGKHCFIGAGCVVTQNIPDYCVTVGNPARIIKRYNPQSQTWEKI
jgi:bifunctional N-acetylglucosamine-1-phosphate-uridyltransferase/glucosamine-1-phosphate-acetyltransferase GlmU-like protein